MGYTPRIFIKKSDLDKKESEITEGFYNQKTEAGKRAYESLEDALKLKPIKFPEIELVHIQPELTQHHKDVLKLLNKFKIEYKLDY